MWKRQAKISWFIVKAIGKLFSGELSFSSLAGPISIAQGAGASSNAGVIYFLSFLALISVNLGIMNFISVASFRWWTSRIFGGGSYQRKTCFRTGTKFKLSYRAHNLVNSNNFCAF